eukprot:NODE_367_length_10044_cov_0.769432.p7 type:complete len:103 gc:universal NODE_367_length_10044_cov_0.769432:6354-6046(-)
MKAKLRSYLDSSLNQKPSNPANSTDKYMSRKEFHGLTHFKIAQDKKNKPRHDTGKRIRYHNGRHNLMRLYRRRNIRTNGMKERNNFNHHGTVYTFKLRRYGE